MGDGDTGSWRRLTKCAFVSFRDFHERVVAPLGAGEDSPAIIVPVDYEMGVTQDGNEKSDGKSWDGRGILDQEPPCRRRLITQDSNQCPNLP